MKRSLILVLILAFFSACSSNETIDPNSAEGLYNRGLDLEKNERYEEAAEKFKEVRNKFPYSKVTTDAELKLADVYYKQESFPEAQVAYQSFKDLHPKHPTIDYVTFQLAMSYYMQLPSTIDRDLTLSQKAITYFDEVITSYPNSKHFKEAKDKKQDVRTKLASKEDYIADFYFKRERYESALGRYEELLEEYPNLGFDERALFRAAYSAHKIGQLDKSNKYYSKLKEKHPSSDFIKQMAKLKGSDGKH
jgi:outer membrane protein assembly factor BamD